MSSTQALDADTANSRLAAVQDLLHRFTYLVPVRELRAALRGEQPDLADAALLNDVADANLTGGEA